MASTLKTTADEMTAWQFLSMPVPKKPIVILCQNGKRYGGFRCYAHAEWVADRLGLVDFEIHELEAEAR